MDEYPQSAQNTPYSSDANAKIRDIEEKQRLLKDRIILIGQNLIEHKDSSFQDLQELKKLSLKLSEEVTRMKEFLQRVSEQISEMARKEELMIIQRQFDILKEAVK